MPNLDGIKLSAGSAGYSVTKTFRLSGNDCHDREIRYAALEAGATDFLTRPIDRFECRARCKNPATLRRHQLLNKNRTRLLQEKVDEALKELRIREVDTLLRLAKAAEQRSMATGLHLVRMAKYSAVIARERGLTPDEQRHEPGVPNA
jgi:two-component system response regulator RpfG